MISIRLALLLSIGALWSPQVVRGEKLRATTSTGKEDKLNNRLERERVLKSSKGRYGGGGYYEDEEEETHAPGRYGGGGGYEEETHAPGPEQDDFFAEEDDDYYATVGHHPGEVIGEHAVGGGGGDHVSPYLGFHDYDYLPDNIRPKPFINCLPESWIERRGGRGGRKHHHGDGNWDHHPHPHEHKKKGHHGGGGGGRYKTKGSKGSKGNYEGGGGKGGWGGNSKSKSKSSKGRGKGVHYYNRERELGGRFRTPQEVATPQARHGYNAAPQVREYGGKGGFQRGHPGPRGQTNTRGGNDYYGGTSTGYLVDQPSYNEGHDDPAIEGVKNKIAKYYHDKEGTKGDKEARKGPKGSPPEPHHHDAPTPRGLPICPRPGRGVVPTISPVNGTDADGDDIEDLMMSDGAPVNIPPGTMRILVKSALQYGFFDTATLREPTQAELDGIMAKTTEFYETILRQRYPNLDSFQAVFISTATDLTMAMGTPVRIDFDANAFFTDGTTIPSPNDVFNVLDQADYQGKLPKQVQLFVLCECAHGVSNRGFLTFSPFLLAAAH